MVDGVSVEQEFGYKDNNGNLLNGKGIVTIAEDKTVKQPSLIAAITGAPVTYVFTKAVVTAGDKQVTGTVTPVLTTVHLSVVSGELTADALLGGEIGQTQSYDTGVWGCDVHLDANSVVYAWFVSETSFSDATSASVSIDNAPDHPDPNPEPEQPRDYTISEDVDAVPDILNDATDFTFVARISGPADLANIKLYVLDTDTNEYVFMESATSLDSGEYRMESVWNRSGTPYKKFRIQAGTNDANGELSVSVETYEAKCLSGDTLITLADGTEQRLDELTGTEMVLGGDLHPARILRLARGLWSDRHTLYHFDDETVIDETHEHRFFNVEQGFWQKLKNWHVGDHAKRLDGGAPALVSVEPKEERAEMFGIWVERGSYWANGLLSGDASANRPLLANATVEQAIDMAESLTEKDLMRILGGGVPL